MPVNVSSACAPIGNRSNATPSTIPSHLVMTSLPLLGCDAHPFWPHHEAKIHYPSFKFIRGLGDQNNLPLSIDLRQARRTVERLPTVSSTTAVTTNPPAGGIFRRGHYREGDHFRFFAANFLSYRGGRRSPGDRRMKSFLPGKISAWCLCYTRTPPTARSKNYAANSRQRQTARS